MSIFAHRVMPGANHVFCFHTLLEGSCWAELTDGTREFVRLQAGDVIAFPRDARHTLCSNRGMRATPALAHRHYPHDRELPYVFNEGAGSDTCHFVCGYLGCDTAPFNPFFDSLPRVLHARGTASGQGWLALLGRQAASESETRRAGGETVLAKLAELMFVEVMRQYVDSLPQDSRGWLAGLKDGHVGHALRLIHGNPAEDWTLARIARVVGLSRSVFAERFTQFVRVSPIQYVGCWRMQLAARQLERPGVSIAQAGAEVGYESEAAFNRAFKKYVGSHRVLGGGAGQLPKSRRCDEAESRLRGRFLRSARSSVTSAIMLRRKRWRSHEGRGLDHRPLRAVSVPGGVGLRDVSCRLAARLNRAHNEC